ncbi:MAG: HAD family hydrolase [Promethearchaeota archaeon]
MRLNNDELSSIKGVIFDFDFTLANSSKGVVKCVNYALKQLGLEEYPEKEIYKTIGLSLDHTLIQLVGNHHVDKIELFKHYFIKKADDIMANLTILFPETPNVIKKLYNHGLKLSIVSTKFRYRIKTILSRENLLDNFEFIVGGEDISTPKPDPFGLMLAVKNLNLLHSEVIYIGDSITDAETANRADIPFIAVLSGVTPRKAFRPYQVREFLGELSELLNLLHIE